MAQVQNPGHLKVGSNRGQEYSHTNTQTALEYYQNPCCELLTSITYKGPPLCPCSEWCPYFLTDSQMSTMNTGQKDLLCSMSPPRIPDPVLLDPVFLDPVLQELMAPGPHASGPSTVSASQREPIPLPAQAPGQCQWMQARDTWLTPPYPTAT